MSAGHAATRPSPMMRSQAVRAGAFCQGMSLLPEDMPWITGWESNPLLSHIVLKRGGRLVAPFFVATLFHLSVHLILPPMVAMIATPFTFAAFLFMATAYLAATYPGSVRPLFDGNTLATPLSAAELMQAAVLPPWAIGFGLLTPLMVLDFLVAAVWHWQSDAVWIVAVLASVWVRMVATTVVQTLCNHVIASMAVASLRAGHSLSDTIRRSVVVDMPRHLVIATWPFLLASALLAVNYLLLGGRVPPVFLMLPILLARRSEQPAIASLSLPHVRLNELWQAYPDWRLFESDRSS